MDNIEFATSTARRLIHENHLYGWRFELDNARTRGGACHYGEKKVTMSRQLLPKWTQEQILDTLIHEVAHALTPGHSHDATWAAKARELGGTGKRTHDNATAEPRYTGICPTHGVVGKRHQLARQMRNAICRRCHQRITWQDAKNSAPASVAVPVAAEAPARPAGPECAHGCGGTTKGGRYLPGHDAKHLTNLFADVQAKLKTPAEALAELDGQANLHNKLVNRLWKAGFQFDPETRRWS